ncbi:histone deacetylase [Plantactinospora sp. S1510]|uniref:Histone deacetylase n=1 Tax=Plantactinospora alkalitolerans TaxID=2789879 RepID=A0ABS0GQE9_9ACTN|nr:histone deacetylase [Plantactinospora alkalitolerans]MBF9128326.1 histone deacetylase [Plantactinospora alkalitolerans]
MPLGPRTPSDPDPPTARALDLVWYAAYGSNMHADRLRYYLAGGRPEGGRRRYPGCRDSRPPRRTVPVLLPGGIYFALESMAWTGGMAFYDPELPGRAAARAYLITAAQFADIANQEMYQPPGTDPDLIEAAVAQGRAYLGPGRYETLVCAGTREGLPLLTFTAPWRAEEVEPAPPAPRYLAMIASGLHEAHGWTAAQITAYLAGRPGVAGRWRSVDVDEVVLRAVRNGPPDPAARWTG